MEEQDYKTIGIVGSRRRNSEKDFDLLVKVFFSIYESGDRIVSGGCPKGADNFAERIAKKYQIPITIHYAQWDKLGRQAGFIRNSDIAEECNVLLAAVAEDRKGGTEDTVNKAHILEKEVVLT